MKNIVSLDDWRNKTSSAAQLRSYADYLELLSPEEIQIETKYLNSLLDKEPLEIETLKKSRLLLTEVKARTKDISPAKATSLNEMIKVISEKLDTFSEN